MMNKPNMYASLILCTVNDCNMCQNDHMNAEDMYINPVVYYMCYQMRELTKVLL